jgi:hypothetical protein
VLLAVAADLEDPHPRLAIGMMQKFHVALAVKAAIVRELLEMTR